MLSPTNNLFLGSIFKKLKYLPAKEDLSESSFAADDLIAIEATKNNFDCVVVSIDKDMLQIPCWHYNHFKNVLTKVEPFEGNKFFYTQILTGDSADNIHGLSQVGPVKASNILKGLETEQDMWDAVLDAYDGDVDRVLENARLLWLRRYEGEIWQPPDKR